MMDKKTIQAIKDSIKHWEVDILKPLREGKKIGGSLIVRWLRKDGSLGKKEVKCSTADCALCKLFYHPYTDCDRCPLNIIDNDCCDSGSSYLAFRDNPNIKTAEAMINTLKSLLEGDKK
jgi:hypothetical protein